MGHDTHFLSRLTRVSDADVDLAMSLYRDVPLVRSVVEAAPVPDDVTRLAIALDASDAPPLVLVERSGKFVTCLAPGMKTDLPIISRAALDRALRDKQKLGVMKEVNERFESAWKKRPPVIEHFERIDLEMMEVFLVTAPFNVTSSLEELNSASRTMAITLRGLPRREKIRPRDTPLLQKVWGRGWLSAHYILDVAAGLRGSACDTEHLRQFITCQQLISACLVLPWTLRGVWAGAHLGKLLLPQLKESLPLPTHFSAVTALTLGAMALGHRKLEGEIRKLLERHTDKFGCEHVLQVLDQPDRYTPTALRVAARTGVQLTADLPKDHPGRFHTEDEVPADYTLALLGQAPLARVDKETWTALVGALPLVARADAQDFYLPHAVMSRWKVLDGVDVVRRVVEEAIPRVASRQVRAPDTPGRNDPCHCGSGRKYKKCCAA